MVTCHLCPPEDRQHCTTNGGLRVHLANVHNTATPCSPFCDTLCTLSDDQSCIRYPHFFSAARGEHTNVFQHFGLSLRFFITLRVQLGRISTDDDGLQVSDHFFQSGPLSLWSQHDSIASIRQSAAEISNRLENSQAQGSGFFLTRVHGCILNIGLYRPEQTGCSHFQLPCELAKKQCLVNVNKGIYEDEKNMCFRFLSSGRFRPRCQI